MLEAHGDLIMSSWREAPGGAPARQHAGRGAVPLGGLAARARSTIIHLTRFPGLRRAGGGRMPQGPDTPLRPPPRACLSHGIELEL